MHSSEGVVAPGTEPARGERRRLRALADGGTDGNEQLTAAAGVVLLVLLAVLGVTILRVRQLISVHLFVGLLLMGPVALKLGSTGYRFARYYTHNAAYARKGPPALGLRLIAPIVVLTTVVVFVTGVVLMFAGPAHRSVWLALHKVSFIVWLGFTALHVLGHLPGLGRSLRAVDARGDESGSARAGAVGRWLLVAGALIGGLVLAIVLIPQFAPWTANGALVQHHDG